MSININSESACRKAYLNYHCYGNSMGISAKEMGEITQVWSDKLSSWQKTVSSDENEYDFDDSDYASYKDKGKDAAKKATGGYERGIGDKVKSYGMTGAIAADFAIKVWDFVDFVGGSSVDKVMGWVASAKSAALAVAYWASKPNKEAKEACDELQDQMAAAQKDLGDAQTEMDEMADEIQSLSDEAETETEEANEENKKTRSAVDIQRDSYLALNEKIAAGEPLTESEKALYQKSIEAQDDYDKTFQKNLIETTTDELADLYDEMGTYQDGYDNTAERMGEVEGLTDYAEGFDSETQTSCYILGGALAASAAGSTAIATKLFLDTNVWTKAVSAVFACTSAAAAVSEGLASAQQFDWAGVVGQEIDMRKATQDINSETMDMYDEEIDAYDGWMQGVGDLKVDEYDNYNVQDSAQLPEGPTGVTGHPKPKKDEEEG